MRKTKKAYFEKLNLKEIGDNKTFWKTVRPYFSDKDNKSSKITLVENNIVIADEKRVAELMNKYFINITKNLNLKALIINTTDDIQSLTKNYENHISVRKIKEAYPEIVPDSFHFKSVSLEDVKKEVLNLNPKKSSTSGTIPVTILKQTIDVHLQHLTNAINHTLQTNCFPDKLKQSKIIPVYKNLDPLEKENYRPVSLLPHVSKVFERIIYKQINTYMEDKISNYVTGFRKHMELNILWL